MHRRDPDATPRPRWTEADFAVAARLKNATDAPEAPASLLRPVAWYGSRWTLLPLLFAPLLAAWAFIDFVYPPPVVRDAMVHEHREATLRGDFMPDKGPVYAAIGLGPDGSVPGLVQLVRPCDIDGKVAYHLTTFLEQGGGMVTILAFRKSLSGVHPGEHGSWMGRYWRFADTAPGRTVLLLADNARVLAETEHALSRNEGPLPSSLTPSGGGPGNGPALGALEGG